MQGLIGWWMVKSGLVNRPDVSHYRLTVHLDMAFMLHILLLWTALSPLRSVNEDRRASRNEILWAICTDSVWMCLSDCFIRRINGRFKCRSSI